MTISSASNVNVLQQLTGSSTPSGVGRGAAPGRLPSVDLDRFQLSPSAMMMQQFLSQTGEADSDNGLSGLELLKQSGEMLAGLLQSKLNNFETDLASTVKAAGLDPMQAMTMQQGADGLLLMNTGLDQEPLEQLLGKNGMLTNQFSEISRLAELLGMLQQAGSTAAGTTAAARYAQTDRGAQQNPDAKFVLNMMQGSASFSFE